LICLLSTMLLLLRITFTSQSLLLPLTVILKPPTTPAFNHHSAVDAFAPSASLQLPVSVLHSSVNLLLPSPLSPSW
jgi:hypothetical protein